MSALVDRREKSAMDDVRISAGATIDRILFGRAAEDRGATAFTILDDQGAIREDFTYAKLGAWVAQVAGNLHRAGLGDQRIVLALPPGRDYVVALLACFLAGSAAVPVPVPPDETPSALGQLVRVVRASGAQGVISVGPALGAIRDAIAREGTSVRLLSVEECHLGSAPLATSGRAKPETLALIQFSSGSTGAPKGVLLTHRNLVSNLELIRRAFAHGPASRGLSWLPQHHNMGMVGGILEPLYAGFPSVLMSPAAFLKDPFRWLEAIARFRVTTSGAPNFAYQLCAQRIPLEAAARLDLRCWTHAFCAGEPIRPETISAFVERFASSGFDPHAFRPVYGLAESTLIVSMQSGRPDDRVASFARELLKRGKVEKDSSDGVALVSCGEPLGNQTCKIVNPDLREEVGPEEVGEIWLQSDCVGMGYCGSGESAETFAATLANDPGGTFLRTGDLAFIHKKQLYVVGRLKEIIIQSGRKLHPEDLESALPKASSEQVGRAAAVAIETPTDQRIVLLLELSKGAPLDFETHTREVKLHFAQANGVRLHRIVYLMPGALPLTAVGKMRRVPARDAYLAGKLRKSEIQAHLVNHIARYLKIGVADIDVDESIFAYGIDSVGVQQVAGEVERSTALPVHLHALKEHGSISAISEHLLRFEEARAASSPS